MFLGVALAAGADHASGPRSAGGVTEFSSSPSVGLLRVTGSSPGAISLQWPVTSDLFFVNYTIEYSSNGSTGPWTIVGVTTNSSATTFFLEGLAPNQTYSYEVVEYSSLGVGTPTNVVTHAQPPSARLWVRAINSSAVRLSWTNAGQYGGNVAFQQYQLLESSGGGSWGIAANVSSVAARNLTVAGLAPSTPYGFQIATTDACVGAANCYVGFPVSTTSSTEATWSTPGPLTARASSNVSATYVNLPVRFTCSGAGGSGPFTYNWSLGDGSVAKVATIVHRYLAPGNYSATCAVSDSLGSHAVSSTRLNVSQTPSSTGNGSGGGGGPPPTSNGSGGSPGGNPPPAGGTPGSGSGAHPLALRAVLVLLAIAIGGATIVLALAIRRPTRPGAPESSPVPAPPRSADPPPGRASVPPATSRPTAASTVQSSDDPVAEIDRLMDSLHRSSR